jgi:hypothetical protein
MDNPVAPTTRRRAVYATYGKSLREAHDQFRLPHVHEYQRTLLASAPYIGRPAGAFFVYARNAR